MLVAVGAVLLAKWSARQSAPVDRPHRVVHNASNPVKPDRKQAIPDEVAQRTEPREETIPAELHGNSVLMGQVVNAISGAPVAGAKVTAGGNVQGVEADAEGKFTFEGLCRGPVEIEVAATGFVAQKVSMEIAEQEETIRVELHGNSVLTGRVVNAISGSPVAGAKVTAPGVPQGFETDAEGEFSVEGLSRGPVEIEIAAAGFVPLKVSKEITGQEETIRVELRGDAMLTGRVVNALSGLPLPKARVKVTGVPQGVETDAEGKFTFEGLCRGPVEIEVAATGFVAQKVSMEIAEQEETVRVELHGNSVLTGQVVSAPSGLPVPNAHVTVTGVPQGVATDAEGKFSIEGLCPGPVEIEVAATGFVPQETSKDLTKQAETIRVELRGTATLSGQVVDADSEAPIRGARVRTRAGGRADTGADGRFSIGDQPAGPMDVHVAAAGYASRLLTEELAAGAEKLIRVELRKDASVVQPSAEPSVTFFGIETRAGSVGYVVDCSGSMSGRRLERAKAELADSIIGLDPEQHFYATFFSDDPVPMTEAPRAPVPASLLEKVRAYNWLKGIESRNGTFPEASLQMVARMKPSVIFLLSDGEFGAPLQPDTFRLFKDNRVRVSTVAFEDQSGGQTLEGIAQTTGGSYKFVPAGGPPPQHEVMIGTRLLLLLIDALYDPPSNDRRQVVDALAELCDRQNFGPAADASPAEVKRAADAWTAWWVDHRLAPAFEELSRNELIREFTASPAVSRWGALDAARRKQLFLPDHYIASLDDAESVVRQAARAALVALAGGVDYGPEPDATDAERAKAVAQWKAWADIRKQIEALPSESSDVVQSRFQHPHPAVRRAAVAVARERQLEAWDDYIRAVESDPDLSVRQEANQGLVELADGRASFAPPQGAGEAEWARVASKWKRWRINQLQMVAEDKLQQVKQVYENHVKTGQFQKNAGLLKQRFQEIIDQYPGTRAAEDAQRYLDRPELKYAGSDSEPARSP